MFVRVVMPCVSCTGSQCELSHCTENILYCIYKEFILKCGIAVDFEMGMDFRPDIMLQGLLEWRIVAGTGTGTEKWARKSMGTGQDFGIHFKAIIHWGPVERASTRAGHFDSVTQRSIITLPIQ